MLHLYSFVATVDDDSSIWAPQDCGSYTVNDREEAVENGVREALARWGYQVGDVTGLTEQKDGTWTGFVETSAYYLARCGWGGVSLRLKKL